MIKYFRFTKKRVTAFCLISLVILILQVILTGSMVSRQRVTTEAGNSGSAVIGILDKTEIVRQKFQFDRKVILTEFSLSFGSFVRKEVGENLNIQMTDGDNNIVYETTVPVKDITPNASYRIPMDYTVTIPRGVTCCIKISCSSKNKQYDTIPTLNTTNRTDPNTYMSTLKMQTYKKCLNISYTYYYRQLFPLILLILEFAALFLLCFERITEYGVLFAKKRQKKERQLLHVQELELKAQEKRKHSKSLSAKIRYSHANMKEKNNRKRDARNEAWKKKNNRKSRSLKEFVKWCLTEPKVIRWIRIAVILVNPLLIMFMVELLNENLTGMGVNIWIFTWLFLLALEGFFYAVFSNISIAVLVLDCILFPLGLTNLILMNVRGTPFLPGDLLAIGTATKVANTYQISLTPAQFVALPAFIIWCFFLFRIKERSRTCNLRKKLVKRLIPAAASCLVIGILYNTSILENFKIADNVWNKVASSRTNGFYLNFFLNIHYLNVSKPEGYSQERVASILEEFQKEPPVSDDLLQKTDKGENRITSNRDYKTNQTLNGKKPNIILIMNESLADYDLIAKTNYNRDPLAYIHSLKENTIFGKDYVSVYGAGTSNSEFEAMTGNTMTFFPSGCNVYQQFMHDTTFSMAYYLKSLGYGTFAVHPSSGANWNRINTYQSMRFDRFITIDDFKNPEYIRYISDKESYKKVIELYEGKKKDTPMFVFDMTIQNHGGYLTNTNWKEPVYVKGSYYAEAKEFLSATKVSDDAFRYLVNYFKHADEPTIICMFGDHQPSIETEFYEEIFGKNQNDWSFEDLQKRFVTPFIVWANYDIPEGQDAVLSNNYIENLVLKQAGLPLPLYNQYIEKVSEEIPVMNVNGYMDHSGKWHKYDTDKPKAVQELLDNYELLQYGYYSDSDKDEMKTLFQIADKK